MAAYTAKENRSFLMKCVSYEGESNMASSFDHEYFFDTQHTLLHLLCQKLAFFEFV